MTIRTATSDPIAEDAFHLQLRAATRADHEAVDAAFGRFDLADAADYGAFLSAHARCLPPLEARLISAGLLAPERGRAAALAADLAALGQEMPAPLAIPLPAGEGALWGVLYVTEGSRLGGAMLARQVGPGLPSAYLSATHGPGGWRRTLAAIDEAAADPALRDAAREAARATFAAYRRAAGETLPA